jgi:hypothetical protein
LNINEVQKIFYAQRTEPAKGSTTPNFETTEEKVIRLGVTGKRTNVTFRGISEDKTLPINCYGKSLPDLF